VAFFVFAYLTQHMSPKRRVAIVVPALSTRGGLTSVALFLRRAMLASGRYEPHLISLATSSTDQNSMRFLSPSTWFRGVQITPALIGDTPYLHVGSEGAELEPLRYRPRRALTELLDEFDLVQLVAGTPALAHVTRDVRRPVALQCATMVAVERRALLNRRGAATTWRRLMTAVVARLDETGLQHADIVLVENTWMRDRVAAAVGRDRVRFAPPGIDTSVFRPSGDRDSRVVLAVGRLDDPRKNIAMLVEAFAIARKQLSTDIRLMLAGERPPGADITDLAARLGVANAIDIRLSLSLEDLAALYRRAAIFALSSDEEGLGIVVLEAMASGAPVVCTRCGGPETSVVHGETGFLVPTGDVRAFADGLIALFSDARLRTRMGEAARAHVEHTFSLQPTGEAFVNAYDELLGCPAGAHGAVDSSHAPRP
jgi:glycosyltransferase involved in cell wall biosynthesis